MKGYYSSLLQAGLHLTFLTEGKVKTNFLVIKKELKLITVLTKTLQGAIHNYEGSELDRTFSKIYTVPIP